MEEKRGNNHLTLGKGGMQFRQAVRKEEGEEWRVLGKGSCREKGEGVKM